VTSFRYDPELLAAFPTIRAGILRATIAENGLTPPPLQEAFRREQEAVLARLGDTSLAALPGIAAWRRAFTAFGVKPTQYRSAAEALLRRLTKAGEIPNISLLVDLGNLVSIRYALPVAIFDTRAIEGGLTVRFATGDERFMDLGTEIIERPQPGEVIFADEAGWVHARRWCWRQSQASAVSPTTTSLLIVTEGHHDVAQQETRAALADLLSLLEAQGAITGDSALLSPDVPLFP
jgi:DNA/RNA-binding domain of Phe-tRNA-synthetase-like protein